MHYFRQFTDQRSTRVAEKNVENVLCLDYRTKPDLDFMVGLMRVDVHTVHNLRNPVVRAYSPCNSIIGDPLQAAHGVRLYWGTLVCV